MKWHINPRKSPEEKITIERLQRLRKPKPPPKLTNKPPPMPPMGYSMVSGPMAWLMPEEFDALAERLGLVPTAEQPESGIVFKTDLGFYTLIDVIEALMTDGTTD